MTLLIRSGRIGGSRTDERRWSECRVAVAVFTMLVTSGVGSVAPISPVFAQTAGTAGPVSLGDLFKGDDSVDLRDGAKEKLREAGAQTFHPRGGCAEKAKFKVIVKSGDPLFQPALAQARRDVLKAVLADSPLASRFEFSYGVGSKADVQVDYERMQDKEKPKLHTNSVPPKGSKVKPGDRITVTMVARDDATTWQTGIQRIQLIAQNPGGDELVGAQDYPPVIRANCEGRPEPRTLVLTYTVPRNPPPIVRLRAITEDFVNLSDFDLGEFPTGDWYGTFKWVHLCTGATRDETHGTADLTLDYDGRGNLTGTLAGSTPQRSMSYPGCSSFVWVTPGTFSARLIGSYTPTQSAFSVQAVDVRNTWGRASYCGPVVESAFAQIHESPMFGDSFRQLRREPDGSRASSGESTFSAGGATCTTTYSLTLRQAQN